MVDEPLHTESRDEIPNPRRIYEKSGEAGLRDRLEGMERDALEKVVRTHPPHHTAPPALQSLSDEEMISYIVDGAARAAE